MIPLVENVLNSLKKLIKKAIKSEILRRSYVIILKGPHNSGKSYILEELVSEFKENMILLNFNLLYTTHSRERLEAEKKKEHPLKIIRDSIETYGTKYDIIALDHMERYYNSVDQIEPLISTLIQKSKQIYSNNHHLIIILTFPISDSLEGLNKSFSDLGDQRNVVDIFCL